MSTGQTSASLVATAVSWATASSTSTAMKMASALMPLRSPPRGIQGGWVRFLRTGIGLGPLHPRQLGLHDLRDLRDLLCDGDPRLGQARDLLARRVLLALDDRAGVAEAHARHLVHEPPGHEGDDRQARVVLGPPAGELGLHAPARLGVDDDALGLLVGLEERHEL